MPPRKHVVITGTGRTGTTFLVELLTHMGLDTGYTADTLPTRKSAVANAGLEHDIRRDDCPFIAKSPWFCDYAQEALSRDDLVIEHIFIPIRDLFAAAESRRQVESASLSRMSFVKRLKRKIRPRNNAGGLWHARTNEPGRADELLLPNRQEQVLLEKIYNLLLGVSGNQVPVTLLRYPDLAEDCQYVFAKLKPVLGDASYETFRIAFDKVVRPDLVHDFSQRETGQT